MIKYRGMKYAVIRIQGQQFRVTEGEEILVGKLGEKEAEAEVLLLVDDDQVMVGQPVVDKARVKVKVLGEEKGGKIYVQKYKAKSRYRRKLGFRPQYSRVLIEKIG